VNKRIGTIAIQAHFTKDNLRERRRPGRVGK
jgi:hypothetical protein